MSALEPAMSLLGVMTADEARAHLHDIAGAGSFTAEESQALWKASREAYGPVHRAPGIPDIDEIPSSVWNHLLRLPEHESFAAMVHGFRWSIRLVEIDALMSVAIDLFVSRVEQWVRQLSGADLLRVVEASLPRQAAPLPVIVAPPLAYVVHSDLGATWMYDPQSGLSPLIVKPPLAVRAAEIAGRLYLIDGYHRAVALRRLGHRYIPCLILHDCNWAVLRMTPRQRRFEPPPFARPDPPCLGHFLTPTAVSTRAMRQVRVMAMRVESFIAPLVELPLASAP